MNQKTDVKVLIAYYVTIAAFIVASLWPDCRVWGFNWWAHLSGALWWALLVIGLAAPLPIRFLVKHSAKEGSPKSQRSLLSIATTAAMIIIGGITFIIWPSTTHFLGDGYQLLARVADQVPSMKSWDIGASMVHDMIFSQVQGDPMVRAIQTYRIVSVASGILLLLIAGFFSYRLFQNTFKQTLFTLGISSGGYMLMFFGYVENYALFTVAMMLFGLMGLLICRGLASKWWSIPILVVASCLHIFGFLLVPGTLYLLFRETSLATGLSAFCSRRWRYMLLGGMLILGALYVYLYSHYRFFTFAFLPVLPDRFTVEGDWLFSFKHITDVANLMMILLPGLPVILTAWFHLPVKETVRPPEVRFLIALLVPSLIAIYCFNPGIGMPRNWDLFSIVGVPLALLGYYVLLRINRLGRTTGVSVALSIVLSLLMLAPRVVSQHIPEIAISHFENYLKLDRIRNRNARSLLLDYYRNRGDSASVRSVQNRIDRDFPESALNSQAKQLMGRGDYDSAMRHLQRALDINPIYVDAWGNLGGCLLAKGQTDSALILLEIADGLNPYNCGTITNIGTAHLRLGEHQKAEEYFLRALAIDSNEVNALAGLASVCLSLGQYDQSLQYVTRLGSVEDMPYDYFRQAGDAYLEAKAFQQATAAYEIAIKRGLNSDYVRQLQSKHPQLKQ